MLLGLRLKFFAAKLSAASKSSLADFSVSIKF